MNSLKKNKEKVEPRSTKLEQVNYAKASSTGDASAIQTGNKRRCIYCGQFAPLVWVHGHGQCSSCGINVDECCRGESCDFE